MLDLSCSRKVYDQLCQRIPGGVNSPARALPCSGGLPIVAESAKGAEVVDADGRHYIDFCGSWGAMILGHAREEVLDKVQERMRKGTTFGMTTEIEGKLAELICQRVPSVEKVRFVSSGTEATMSAARLARGVTGRSLIVKFTGHYHGHADCFLVQAGSGVAGLNSTSSSAGVSESIAAETICLPFNCERTLREFFAESSRAAQVAAVIVEPIAGNMGVVPGSLSFLQTLREETQRVGALLIFDEVITGFRVSPQGAQGIYSIRPDLTCFGKIIGGGFPAAAFGGSAELMDHLAPLGKVYQAGTLSGNPVAMEAGYQTLLRCTPDLYDELERKMKRFVDPVNEKIRSDGLKACLQYVGSMFTLFFGKTAVHCMEDAQACRLDLHREYFQYLFDQGIYVPPSQFEACFVSAAHKEEHLNSLKEGVLDFLGKIDV